MGLGLTGLTGLVVGVFCELLFDASGKLGEGLGEGPLLLSELGIGFIGLGAGMLRGPPYIRPLGL